MPNPANSVNAVQNLMADPAMARTIEEQVQRCQPAMDKFEQLISERDPLLTESARDIACHVCDIHAQLGVPFDPVMASLIMQYVGQLMVSSDERWVRYTADTAPAVNARRLKQILERG